MNATKRDYWAEASTWANEKCPPPRHEPVMYGIFGGLFTYLLAHVFIAIGFFFGSVIASRIDWEPVIIMLIGFTVPFCWAWLARRRYYDEIARKAAELREDARGEAEYERAREEQFRARLGRGFAGTGSD